MFKILYVTPMWSGLKDLLEGTDRTAKGMPAFIEPLRRISDAADVRLCILDKKTYKIGSKVEGASVVLSIALPKSKILAVTALLRSAFSIAHYCIREKVSLVYCHGSMGCIGTLAAWFARKPHAHRLYGTFLATELDSSRSQLVIRHPLEALTFIRPGQFLLVTNDGTKGDLVFAKLNWKMKDKKRFYFWLNGVSKSHQSFALLQSDEMENTLLYVARFDPWKGQHRAIELLSKLKAVGRSVRLLFLGHIRDEEYLTNLKASITRAGLEDFIEFGGTKSRNELYELYSRCLAVLSFYDFSNLGNVAIEALSAGGRLVCLNDGSMDGLIENGHNGFLVHNMDEAATVVENLIIDEKIRKRVSEAAVISANKNFRSWDERSASEMGLVFMACNSKVGQFKTRQISAGKSQT